MRRIAHWTPRYVVQRSRNKIYSRVHPGDPWLTADAIRLLSGMLRPTDVGLEFGSGRSTSWLAARVAHLTSVEHDQSWHNRVSRELKELQVAVDYLFVPRDVPEQQGQDSSYAAVAGRFADDSLDVALVDGAYRDACMTRLLPKIRKGGLLVLDNAEWYLPSTSNVPGARTPAQRPAGPAWTEISQSLRAWRTVWTSNGVWDTAVFVRT